MGLIEFAGLFTECLVEVEFELESVVGDGYGSLFRVEGVGIYFLLGPVAHLVVLRVGAVVVYLQ